MGSRALLLLSTLILLGGAFLRLAELSHYPPGLHYDEAADMLLSRDIAWYGFRPFPVVAAYSGREALFYYVAAPLVRLMSAEPHVPPVLATRLTSAFLGILTIAATIALGRAMFRSHRRATLIALLAGAWLAVNGPQVWLMRQGFRTSPQPLLEAVALWMLFVALRRPTGRRWLLPAMLGGVFAGLALYVYMAARIFPVWLASVLFVHVILERRAFFARLRRAATFALAMAATAAPIGIYYLQHPDVLFDRLAQVGPSGGTLTLAQSVQAHLEMFFLKGDPLLRYNLYPGRPWFDPVSGVLMLIGLGAAVALFLRRGDPGLRLAGASIALAPLLILPSVIAVGGLPPSHMRSVAMVPLIFFGPALGAAWMMGWVKRRTSPPGPLSTVATPHRPLNAERSMGTRSGTSATPERGNQPAHTHHAAPPLYGTPWKGDLGVRVILFAFLVLVGLNTWADYRAWAGRADLFYDSDGDMDAAARWLEHNAAPYDVIYVYSRFYEHPTVLAHNVDHGQVRWVMHDQRFEPPPGQRAITIYPQSLIDAGKRATLDALPDRVDGPPAPDGRPAFVAFITPADHPVTACDGDQSLGGVLKVCSAASLTGDPAGNVVGELVWRVLRVPDRADLTPVIRVVDAWDNEITPRVYPYFDQSDRWRPGETITTRFEVQIGADNPPGSYFAEVSWIAREDPARFLPLLDASGAYAGIWQRGIRYDLTAADLPPSQREDVAHLEPIMPGLYVLNVRGLPDRAEQGERLRFSATWYADLAPGDVRPLILMAIPADGGAPIRLWQGDPAHGTYPMRDWAQYQSLTDHYDVRMPPDMPPGSYMLRLDVPGGARPAFTHKIEIVAVERSFHVPPDLEPLDYLLGPGAPMFQLAGYDAARDGQTLHLRLAWRSVQRPPDRDYTIFVHILNPDGTIFSQIDRQPTPPTGRWLIGQVVTETYDLPIPDGAYRIEIGLYLQENGQRLAVTDRADVPLGDAIPLDGP